MVDSFWDFTELAVDTKTFDVTRTNYAVDPPSDTTTSYDWVEFEYCTTTSVSDNSENANCGGPLVIYIITPNQFSLIQVGLLIRSIVHEC